MIQRRWIVILALCSKYSDEIEDEEFLEFAIENLEELFSYIINGNLNIRIHRDITGEMWFGVDNRH